MSVCSEPVDEGAFDRALKSAIVKCPNVTEEEFHRCWDELQSKMSESLSATSCYLDRLCETHSVPIFLLIMQRLSRCEADNFFSGDSIDDDCCLEGFHEMHREIVKHAGASYQIDSELTRTLFHALSKKDAMSFLLNLIKDGGGVSYEFVRSLLSGGENFESECSNINRDVIRAFSGKLTKDGLVDARVVRNLIEYLRSFVKEMQSVSAGDYLLELALAKYLVYRNNMPVIEDLIIVEEDVEFHDHFYNALLYISLLNAGNDGLKDAKHVFGRHSDWSKDMRLLYRDTINHYAYAK